MFSHFYPDSIFESHLSYVCLALHELKVEAFFFPGGSPRGQNPVQGCATGI